MLYILPPVPQPSSIWYVPPNHTWIPEPSRTPQPTPSPTKDPGAGGGGSIDEEDPNKNGRSLSECYFAGKGAAVVLPQHDRRPPTAPSSPQQHQVSSTAPALSQSSSAPNCTSAFSSSSLTNSITSSSSSSNSSNNDIQHHLQSMFYLLRPEETLKMAVKLESVHAGRTRYLVVVSRLGRSRSEESCLLGIDCNHSTTVGLVLKVLADTTITLDGDGGFSVSVCGRQHIFKPVSVQAMWSALQTLHKVSAKAREHNYFLGGLTHDWVAHYEGCIASDRSCLNEWHAMDDLESRRPPSPDSIRHKPGERIETERVIRTALKEIMMSVDLDEVTSKQVRVKLEEALDMDLGEFKSFIDQEMLVILGQMDEATEIFPHVYLGSEWNASNLEELTKNGVCHILNVTREIDNFFPGMFDYLNIRVYDDEKTDLLKHWDDTFKYITKAKKEGSKVLVHCKMGVSRSASVVIAYAMKAYSWDLKKALNYVQMKRNCIKPNSNFISQLETYEGILDAMKNKEKLQRSKSETNLKTSQSGRVRCFGGSESGGSRVRSGGEIGGGEVVIGVRSLLLGEGCQGRKNIMGSYIIGGVGGGGSGRSVSEGETGAMTTVEVSLEEDCILSSSPPLIHPAARPKSWSPDHATANNIFTSSSQPSSQDGTLIERLPVLPDTGNELDARVTVEVVPPHPPPPPPPPLPPSPPPVAARSHNINVRMPCANGLAYSVSQNKAFHLQSTQSGENELSVKHRVSKIHKNLFQESQNTGKGDRKSLSLNLITPPVEEKIEKKGKDLFSTHVDRVFDKEEHTNHEVLSQSSWSGSSDTGSGGSGGVSRQSSWASVEAAGEGGCPLTSRSGSFEGRRKGGEGGVKGETPLSTTTTGGGGVGGSSSKVRNLRREFEAKSNGGSQPPPTGKTTPPPVLINESGDKGGEREQCSEENTRSLPSSPVSEHHRSNQEDRSVRRLVGKYERAPPPRGPPLKQTTAIHNARNSNISNNSNRPPLAPPSVVKATIGSGPTQAQLTVAGIVTKAAAHKKQQQGKTHPLARLIKYRHTNPVYNTM